MTQVLSMIGVGALMLMAAQAQAQQDDLRTAVAADLPELVALYQDLHANPELSFQEVETAKKLAARARALGFEVTEGVGKTGVVAVMQNGPGPVVMLRADMDGLPVIEQTGLPYASKRRAVPATARGGKKAHSRKTSRVPGPIPLRSPPMTPAMATGPLPSVISSVSASRPTSRPSSSMSTW